MSEIEQHADMCSAFFVDMEDEEWLMGVDGTADVSETVEEVQPPVTTGPADVSIKGLILKLQQNIQNTSQPTRVNIRRKSTWEDFRQERRKRCKPERMIKVVFLGEPAIDDGGPKRELFSGLSLNFSLM